MQYHDQIVSKSSKSLAQTLFVVSTALLGACSGDDVKTVDFFSSECPDPMLVQANAPCAAAAGEVCGGSCPQGTTGNATCSCAGGRFLCDMSACEPDTDPECGGLVFPGDRCRGDLQCAAQCESADGEPIDGKMPCRCQAGIWQCLEVACRPRLQNENTRATCHDNRDNDGDGATDCLDLDCAAVCTNEKEAGFAACGDRVDNDGDQDTDCDDADCKPFCGNAAAESNQASCSDNVDNDGNDKTDCEDAKCATFCTKPENTQAACSDGIDNDDDGKPDCEDADCSLFCGVNEENTKALCSDNKDNDGNGYTDCIDFNCAAFCGENSAATCSDNIDNDGDTYVDCHDFNCASFCKEDTPRNCADGIDNDGDGDRDCDDSECAAHCIVTDSCVIATDFGTGRPIGIWGSSCGARCSADTAATIDSCSDDACVSAALDADTTPAASVSGGDPGQTITCSTCYNIYISKCIVDNCPITLAAYDSCSGSCTLEEAALTACIASIPVSALEACETDITDGCF